VAFQLSLATVTSLKRAFRAAFPLYRSAHLHEALAYGFGYRTSAALQADLKQADGEPLHTAFDPWRMRERLVEFGYAVDPHGFERAFVTAIPDAQSVFSSGARQDGAGPDQLEQDRAGVNPRVFFDWGRQPSISREIEGTYRRGLHQAIANVAYAMRVRGEPQTAERLLQWVEGPGTKWRKDGDLAFREEPPPPL